MSIRFGETWLNAVLPSYKELPIVKLGDKHYEDGYPDFGTSRTYYLKNLTITMKRSLHIKPL
ncbi:MAG: hypothetical protein WBG70_17285 [Spirulinaceae cyanobacterium]